MLGWFHAYPDHQSLVFFKKSAFLRCTMNFSNKCCFLGYLIFLCKKNLQQIPCTFVIKSLLFGCFCYRFVLWHVYPWHPLYPPFLSKFFCRPNFASIPKTRQFFLRSDNSCLFLTWWNNRRIFAETSEKSQDGAFLSLRSSPSSPHRIIPWNTDERHPEQK